MGKKKRNTTLKLFLYVAAAVIGAIVADLQHHVCVIRNLVDITPIKLLTGGLNAILQGLIAWRAFIDDSHAKDQDDIEHERLEQQIRSIKDEHFPH
jgi:hypothetical protein